MKDPIRNLLIALAFWCLVVWSMIPAAHAQVTVMSGLVSGYSERCQFNAGTTAWNPDNTCKSRWNSGFGIRADAGPLAGWMAGTYRKDGVTRSWYVANEWKRAVWGPVQFGTLAGLVSGYGRPVTPFILPELVLNTRPFEFAVIAQPIGPSRQVSAQIRISF